MGGIQLIFLDEVILRPAVKTQLTFDIFTGRDNFVPGLRLNKWRLLLWCKHMLGLHRTRFFQHGKTQLTFENGQLRPSTRFGIVLILEALRNTLLVPDWKFLITYQLLHKHLPSISSMLRLAFFW